MNVLPIRVHMSMQERVCFTICVLQIQAEVSGQRIGQRETARARGVGLVGGEGGGEMQTHVPATAAHMTVRTLVALPNMWPTPGPHLQDIHQLGRPYLGQNKRQMHACTHTHSCTGRQRSVDVRCQQPQLPRPHAIYTPSSLLELVSKYSGARKRMA